MVTKPCAERKRLRDDYADVVFRYSELMRQAHDDKSELSARMAVDITMRAYEDRLKEHKCCNPGKLGRREKARRQGAKVRIEGFSEYQVAAICALWRLGTR